jgi:predicted DNA-binding transcriptional regulator AlpA
MSAVEQDDLELLDAQQIAELFKVPLTWVQQATRKRFRNPIPHFKIGHYVRFREADIREWLEKQKRDSAKKGR